MNEIVFTPFKNQENFLFDTNRIKGAFAGKRGGKTEVGAVQGIIYQEEKPNYFPNHIDPYLGIIAAPTYDMLDRLSWAKFVAYAKPFIKHQTNKPKEIIWHDHKDGEYLSKIYGISADKPERLEGVKAAWIWIDEVFQVKEQFFLECLARISDTQGYLFCTGSLGVQYINPKTHWAYKYFKEKTLDGFVCYEWATLENPYFPKQELERLKKTLDEQTYRAMFTLTWDFTPSTAVYPNFSDDNLIDNYVFNPRLETYISIDWGYAHPMAIGFYQYDRDKDQVFKFDEIVKSKLTIDKAYELIASKPYLKTIRKTRTEKDPLGRYVNVEYDYITNVHSWVCDIAGDQERELLGISNTRIFRTKYGINFKKRRSSILYGVSVVRSYIKNTNGETRFFLDKNKCPKTIEGLKRYAFKEKDGIIQNENPIKEMDDEVDETRYFFVNILDPRRVGNSGSSVMLG